MNSHHFNAIALAGEVAELYKQRWQIKLFFKWIKQNLKIKCFAGRSENAVKTQIIIAMIAYLLLKLANQSVASVLSLYIAPQSVKTVFYKFLFPHYHAAFFIFF